MSLVSNVPLVGEIQNLFPGMPISTQDIPGKKEKLNSEQIKVLAGDLQSLPKRSITPNSELQQPEMKTQNHSCNLNLSNQADFAGILKVLALNEVASILSFAEIARLANGIQFNVLPKGITKEEAAKTCSNWVGWKLIAEGKVTFEFFTEYGHAIRRPLEKSNNEYTNQVSQMLQNLNEGEQNSISHRFQHFRADEQAKGKMLPSLTKQGDKGIEEKLNEFISKKGKALLNHLPENEILEKAYKGGEFKEKAPYESARTILGGTCGGFLFALQQGIKGGAVSRNFVDNHKEFIQSTLKVTQLMDYNNYLSFGCGKPGLTDTPSPYAYLQKLFE